jgi:hypothetical protein
MPLRKPLIHRRRQQKTGLTVNLAKVAHRRTQKSNQNRSRDSTQYSGNACVKSDRLEGGMTTPNPDGSTVATIRRTAGRWPGLREPTCDISMLAYRYSALLLAFLCFWNSR